MEPTLIVISIGMLLAAISFAFMFKMFSGPGVIQKQQETLDRQYARMDSMQNELDQLRATMNVDRETFSSLKAEMEEWRNGMELNFQQMSEAGMVPRWSPKVTRNAESPKRTWADLAAFIVDKFNTDEIDSLAFDLGISPDGFYGRTRDARTRELIEYAIRHNKLAELEERARELRS